MGNHETKAVNICSNELCIYEENRQCILNRIELSDGGMCLSCILVTIEPELLLSLKDELFAKLEAQERSW